MCWKNPSDWKKPYIKNSKSFNRLVEKLIFGSSCFLSIEFLKIRKKSSSSQWKQDQGVIWKKALFPMSSSESITVEKLTTKNENWIKLQNLEVSFSNHDRLEALIFDLYRSFFVLSYWSNNRKFPSKQMFETNDS